MNKMELMNLIQQTVFYLIVFGFLGYGGYKLWEFFQQKKKEFDDKYGPLPGKGKKTTLTLKPQQARESNSFKTTDQLKGGFRF